MTNSSDLIELRHLMAVEIDASLALKEAKGGTFLELKNRGVSVQEIWQSIAVNRNLLNLDRAFEEAKADRIVAQMAINFEYRGPDDGEE